MGTTLGDFVDKSTENPNGCWIWNGATDGGGYAIGWYERKTIRAHRISWMLFKGIIPSGRCVLHRCDVRNCVNPGHLFLGTYQDNARDCHSKGRSNTPKGETNGHARLSESQVRAIRVDPRLHREIATDYGVSRAHVTGIRGLKFWKHL